MEARPVPRASIAVLTACGLFVGLNLLVPLTLGDVYPFTVAPMFRDAPRVYCNYRVYAPDGRKLADNSTRRIDPPGSPDPFLLRRYYDGNPCGLGVGVCPPVTIDGGEFGGIHSQEHVRRHIAAHLAEMADLEYVDVEQEIIGPLDFWRVGIQHTNRWRITREAPR